MKSNLPDQKRVHFLEDNHNQKEVLDNLSSIVHSGMTFLDIGANSGEYTFQINKILSKSSIYAVEADPIKFKTLKEKCAKWEGDSDNNIYALQITISDRNRWEVDLFKLDTLFKRINPDLIKIDVEGSELQILQGSTGLLKEGKARFLIGFNKERNSECPNRIAEICNLMNSFGYYPKNFYGKYLFTNPNKHLLHTSKRIYRRILPVAFRQWVRSYL